MSGRPAWPQQNVLPDLLPSSDSYRAIYRYGAEPGLRERSARLRHHRPGSTARMWRREGQRKRIYARVQERGRRRRWRPLRPWIKHLSTAVRSRFWCRSLLRRNSKGSPPYGHRVCGIGPDSQLTLLIVVQENSFFMRFFSPLSQKSIPLINKFVDFFFETMLNLTAILITASWNN